MKWPRLPEKQSRLCSRLLDAPGKKLKLAQRFTSRAFWDRSRGIETNDDPLLKPKAGGFLRSTENTSIMQRLQPSQPGLRPATKTKVITLRYKLVHRVTRQMIPYRSTVFLNSRFGSVLRS
jgi:hypothetical protein